MTLRLSENAAENMQEKNQFARFKILQTEVGEHVCYFELGKADILK